MSGQRFLVVDDSREVADFAGSALRRLGHDPMVIYAGDVALAALASEAFDVLLTDYGMEGISGLGLAREARQAQPDIRVVLMTGWDLTESDVDGFDAVLQKPFTIAQLREVLGRLGLDG